MARVVFLQDLPYEWPAVMALAAVLRAAGHTPQVVIGTGRRAVRAVRAARPDLVAVSMMTYQRPWLGRMTRALRRAGVRAPLLAGGIHPTIQPEERESLGLDAMCRGEGEDTLVEAAEAAAGGGVAALAGIANLSGPGFDNPVRPLIADLDGLPFYDRSVYDGFLFARVLKVRNVLASRGCPYSCSFCHAPGVRRMYRGRGRWYRLRSPARVLDELVAIEARYQPEMFVFQDELFGADASWLAEFLAGYRRRGLKARFGFQTRADCLDPAVVPELRRSGCSHVAVGVESGDAELRGRVLGKRIPDRTFLDLATACRRVGLGLGTTNLFGLPGETLDQALDTVKLNARLRPMRMFSNLMIYYPKLPLTEQALAAGSLRAGDLALLDRPAYRSRRSMLRQPEIHAVENACKLSRLGARLRLPRSVLAALCRLPPNVLYDATELATSALEYVWADEVRNPVRTLLRLALNARAVV